MIPKAIPLKNSALFQLAMTHRSAADDVVRESYERLEFFGDSVLGLVVAQFLYEHHPDWDQGMMSKAKASVVQEGPLAETALRLGLDQHVQLSASGGVAGPPFSLMSLKPSSVGSTWNRGWKRLDGSCSSSLIHSCSK